MFVPSFAGAALLLPWVSFLSKAAETSELPRRFQVIQTAAYLESPTTLKLMLMNTGSHFSPQQEQVF